MTAGAMGWPEGLQPGRLDPAHLHFFVAGIPITQGSKTAIRVGNRAVVVEGKTKKARDSHQAWRHAVATEARQLTHQPQHNTAGWPTSVPVVMSLTFGIQKPVSAPKKKRTWPARARSGDVDKLARSVLDAITGVLVCDDAQIVGLSVTKRYGRPGVHIELWPEHETVLWTPEWHPDRWEGIQP
jgi:Holliday junction resolvase RusA-like endonuclease